MHSTDTAHSSTQTAYRAALTQLTIVLEQPTAALTQLTAAPNQPTTVLTQPTAALEQPTAGLTQLTATPKQPTAGPTQLTAHLNDFVFIVHLDQVELGVHPLPLLPDKMALATPRI